MTFSSIRASDTGYPCTKHMQCSERCGYGTRSRAVQCRSPISLTVVAREFCDSSTMPRTTSSCFVRNCGESAAICQPGSEVCHSISLNIAIIFWNFTDNTCLRDESSLCPLLAANRLCNLEFAMANNGLRCCVSCMGLVGGDQDISQCEVYPNSIISFCDEAQDTRISRSRLVALCGG